MVVEVVEEPVSARGALQVQLATAARSGTIGVPDDGSPDIRVAGQTVETK